jgi:hypothetical protein
MVETLSSIKAISGFNGCPGKISTRNRRSSALRCTTVLRQVLFHIGDENKSQISGLFLRVKNEASFSRDNDAIHHKLTSKSPHQKPAFPKNPLKNPVKPPVRIQNSQQKKNLKTVT